MVGPPHLPAPPDHLEKVEDRAEELLQISEALHLERATPQMLVVELAANHPFRQEVDERVGLGVHVVPIEHDLGVVEHLPQPPDQRLVLRGELLVGSERVQVHAVGFERREVAHITERLGPQAEPA